MLKVLGVVLTILISLWTNNACAQSIPYMSLSEIKSGMQGHADTIIQGTNIVAFPVEIIGVVDGGKGAPGEIMAKASGPIIADTHGVIHGMSGSPVYVNGKLIGAVARSVGNDVLPYIFYITPIESMLKIWNYPDYKKELNKPNKAIEIEKATDYVKNRRQESNEIDEFIERFVNRLLHSATDELPLNNDLAKRIHQILTQSPAKDEEIATDRQGNVGKTDSEDDLVGAEAEMEHEINLDDYIDGKYHDALDDDDIVEGKPINKAKNLPQRDVNENDTDINKPESTEEATNDIKPPAKDSSEEDRAPAKRTITDIILEIIQNRKQQAIRDIADGNSTKIYVAGFTPHSMSYLKYNLASNHYEPLSESLFPKVEGISWGNATDVHYNATLKPGDALGVLLAYGDFAAGASGTVTTVDGNKVLGFGHSMTYRGNVNYFMTDAHVIGSAGGILNGTKVTTFGKIVGRINQDRYTGVAGMLNEYPNSVPIRITIHDRDLQKNILYGSKIVTDEELLSSLAPSIAYGAIDRTIDRLPTGTARVRFRIRTDVMPDGFIRRDNMFYSDTDVSALSLEELHKALQILADNREEASPITDISADVYITTKRLTASIVSATPLKSVVKPGESVDIQVIVKPYRQEELEYIIPYYIPKNQPEGRLYFEVKGGGFIPITQIADSILVQNPIDVGSVTARERLEELRDFNKNNQIIVEPFRKMETEDEEKQAIKEAIKLSRELEKLSRKERLALFRSREAKIATEYIIDNYVQTSVEVKK